MAARLGMTTDGPGARTFRADHRERIFGGRQLLGINL